MLNKNESKRLINTLQSDKRLNPDGRLRVRYSPKEDALYIESRSCPLGSLSVLQHQDQGTADVIFPDGRREDGIPIGRVPRAASYIYEACEAACAPLPYAVHMLRCGTEVPPQELVSSTADRIRSRGVRTRDSVTGERLATVCFDSSSYGDIEDMPHIQTYWGGFCPITAVSASLDRENHDIFIVAEDPDEPGPVHSQWYDGTESDANSDWLYLFEHICACTTASGEEPDEPLDWLNLNRRARGLRKALLLAHSVLACDGSRIVYQVDGKGEAVLWYEDQGGAQESACVHIDDDGFTDALGAFLEKVRER